MAMKLRECDFIHLSDSDDTLVLIYREWLCTLDEL